MGSQSSYERIEYYLNELRAQARSEAQAPPNPPAAQHVQALLVLFKENLQALAPPKDRPPKG